MFQACRKAHLPKLLIRVLGKCPLPTVDVLDLVGVAVHLRSVGTETQSFFQYRFRDHIVHLDGWIHIDGLLGVLEHIDGLGLLTAWSSILPEPRDDGSGCVRRCPRWACHS